MNNLKILTKEEVLEPKNWSKSNKSLSMECIYKDETGQHYLNIPLNRLLYYFQKKGGEEGIRFLIEKELQIRRITSRNLRIG